MFVMTIQGDEKRINEDLGVTLSTFYNNIWSFFEDRGFVRTSENVFEISEDANIIGIMLSSGGDIALDPELLPYITRWDSTSEEEGYSDWLPGMQRSYHRFYG